MTEKEIKDTIIKHLHNEKYGENKIEFDSEPSTGEFRVDLIIKAGKKNIAVIEIKTSNTLTKSKISEAFSPELYFIHKTRYYIYTDGKTFFIYDRLLNPKKIIKTNIDGLNKRITRRISYSSLRKLKEQAIEILQMKIKEKKETFPRLEELMNKEISSIRREMKLSTKYSLFFKSDDANGDSFENQFFVKLLNNEVPDVIYRYYSFSRAFSILKEDEIALLGLPGMNDTTEPNYVDNYLKGVDEDFWDLPHQSISAINRRFIMSCTVNRDDLMQWRLYGDDAKGACIEFKTKRSLSTNQRFYLGRVKYANEDGKHPELLFIKEITKKVREELFVDLKFNLLYVWRHFFKPREYNYEGEVRLLYLHRRQERDKKWILAQPYSIVNPLIVLNLKKEEFPLTITEVMLGPKNPERQVNKVQLKQMLREKKSDIEITESEKNLYR